MTDGASQSNKWAKGVAWALQILGALVFFAAGGAKFAGVERMVDTFEQIGLGQWFRYVTAACEVSGAALLLTPKTALWGAMLLICVMTGAIVTHLFVIGGSFVPALILLCLMGAVAALRR